MQDAATWHILLGVGDKNPQYLRLEVKTQITIGCSDPEKGIAPDLDLIPYGARQMGVSTFHIVLHVAQGGLHVRDLDSLNGTMLNGFPLNPNKLYKMREGDVLVLGQLRILVYTARLANAGTLPGEIRPPDKRTTSKITPNVVQRVINYFRGISAKSVEPVGILPEDVPLITLPDGTEMVTSADTLPLVTSHDIPLAVSPDQPLATDADNAPMETIASAPAQGLSEEAESIATDQNAVVDIQVMPPAETPAVASVEPAIYEENTQDSSISQDLEAVASPQQDVEVPQLSLTSKWKSTAWTILLRIGTELPQYLALEVTGQLTVGYTDPETGISADLDLSLFGVQDPGVSRRHIAFLATQAGLYIRDLESLNGTTLNGFKLDHKQLYRVQKGDVIRLGELSVTLEAIRPSGAARSTMEMPSVFKNDAPQASPTVLHRLIDYLTIPSEERDAASRFQQESTRDEPITDEDAAIFQDDGQPGASTEQGMDGDSYRVVSKEEDTYARAAIIASEKSNREEPIPESLSSKSPILWVIVLSVGTSKPQHVRIEINGQLNIGYSDFETGIFSAVDLSALRVQEMGVSRRHAVLQVSEDQLFIRDLGSLNGTTLNGVLLDPKKLYKVQRGDVIEFGQLRVTLQSAQRVTGMKPTGELRPPVIVEPRNAAPTNAPILKSTGQLAKRNDSPASETGSTSGQVSVARDNKRSTISLEQELLKRQTQESPRVGMYPSISGSKQSTSRAPSMRSSGSRNTVPLKTIPTLSRTQQRTLRIAGAALLVVILVTIIAMTAVRPPTEKPTPTVQTITFVKASDAFSYFRKVGIAVSNFEEINTPNSTWNAIEEIRFDVVQADDRGTMLLLRYDSPAKAAADASKTSQLGSLKKWKIVQVTNFLVVSFPDTPQSISANILNQLKQYLIQTGNMR
jgi:pSer/pThr/pTyr-binding forkhead associated (FHA) protein